MAQEANLTKRFGTELRSVVSVLKGLWYHRYVYAGLLG
jgi:hypothetical protein